jgi:hypothetical protein
VEVKKYVLPKFKIETRFDRPYYQPGETIRLTVHADYFFGKPVGGGEVRVEVRSPGIDVKPAPLEARTDDKGEAILTCKIPEKLVGREQDSGDARLSFRVLPTDSAGQKQDRTVERMVSASPVRIEVLPEGGTLVQGVPNKVYLFVSRPDGTPLPALLKVSGLADALITDNQGLASFEYTPQALDGTWTIQAIDVLGVQATRRVEFHCGRGRLDFLLRTDRAVCEAGQTLHLTALGGGVEPVFVDFLKDGQTLRTQTIAMNDGRGELAFDLPPDLFGTVQVCAYRFNGAGVPVRKTRVLYVRPAGGVKIAATLEGKEYRPGGKAKVNLSLTDAKGAPLPGALSLAAVDEAVFSVLPQRPGMEQNFYLLEQQLLKPVYAIYSWSPEERDANREQALFAATVQEDGEARAINPSRTHSLAADSFPAKVQRTEQTREQGLGWVKVCWVWLLILSVLGVYVSLWSFARWTTVAGVHGVFLILFVPVVLLIAIDGAKPKMALVGGTVKSGAGPRESDLAQSEIGIDDAVASNFNVDRIEDVSVPGPVDPMAPVGIVGEKRPRVRQLFPETLLWKPELITDDQGHATLDISLADSITTWRLAASAVTADGRLGSTQLPLKVFQPFFADLNLPVALTRGDQVGVPVVVYNYLDRPQTVTLTLAAAPWFAALDALEQRLELKPGEVREVRFRLRVLKVGQHKLQATARPSSSARDAGSWAPASPTAPGTPRATPCTTTSPAAPTPSRPDCPPRRTSPGRSSPAAQPPAPLAKLSIISSPTPPRASAIRTSSPWCATPCWRWPPTAPRPPPTSTASPPSSI